eukprot:m.258481 g.258481  ORF g.258481 m.258481 type:complete len:323 (+) comp54577_c1_seq34:1149-2117(+)
MEAPSSFTSPSTDSVLAPDFPPTCQQLRRPEVEGCASATCLLYVGKHTGRPKEDLINPAYRDCTLADLPPVAVCQSGQCDKELCEAVLFRESIGEMRARHDDEAWTKERTKYRNTMSRRKNRTIQPAIGGARESSSVDDVRAGLCTCLQSKLNRKLTRQAVTSQKPRPERRRGSPDEVGEQTSKRRARSEQQQSVQQGPEQEQQELPGSRQGTAGSQSQWQEQLAQEHFDPDQQPQQLEQQDYDMHQQLLMQLLLERSSVPDNQVHGELPGPQHAAYPEQPDDFAAPPANTSHDNRLPDQVLETASFDLFRKPFVHSSHAVD